MLWDQGILLVRQSQTEGDEVMPCTKTGTTQRLTVPKAFIDVLRWHTTTQLRSRPMQESDLLFPSELGGFRSRSVLDRPFAEVARAIGLGKKITPRGMRRTFQDLARAAQMHDLVTRSISGHATDSMQRLYSTVAGAEQAAGLQRIVQLSGAPVPALTGEGGGEVAAGGEDRARCSAES